MPHGRRNAVNIGPGEQRKRRLLGLGLMVLSLGLAIFFTLSSSPIWWRLSLFLPFWGGMLGLLQAHRKT